MPVPPSVSLLLLLGAFMSIPHSVLGAFLPMSLDL